MAVTSMSIEDKRAVLELFGEGWTKKSIAEAYDVSPRTIGRVIKEMEPDEQDSSDEDEDDFFDDDVYDDSFFEDDDDEEDDEPETVVDANAGAGNGESSSYVYNVVATASNIILYRTDTATGENISANVSKYTNERKYNEYMQRLRVNVSDQQVLEDIFNTVHHQTYIESFGTLKVDPVRGVVYQEDADGSTVYFSGGLLDRILTMVREDAAFNPEFEALNKFTARLKNNPSPRAVSELYDFIKHSDIKITPTGMVECYKRVRSDFKDIYTGTLDNSIGQVLEVPRDHVDPDSNRTCSYGLHVCSKTYLPYYGNYYSNVVVKVLVDPADFVAIPSDYNQPILGVLGGVAPSKARVCKYEVVGMATDEDLIG